MAPRRCGRALLRLAPLALLLAPTRCSWPLEHGDSRNSGNTLVAAGGALLEGACRTPLHAAAAAAGAAFAASPITTADGLLTLVGASDNRLYCAPTDPAAPAGRAAVVNLRAAFAAAGLAPPPPSALGAGIVASAAANASRVFVPSTDGALYALDVLVAGDCASLTPAWVAGLGLPVAAAPRLYPDGHPTHVLVGATDTSTDSAGVLHCLDAASGALLWQYAAPNNFGLAGVAPAVDPHGNDATGDHAVFLAAGYSLVALDLLSGRVISSLDLPNHEGTRRFSGAPAFARDGSALFVSGASLGAAGGDGWLWKVNTAGDGVDNKLTLKIAATHQLATSKCGVAAGAPRGWAVAQGGAARGAGGGRGRRGGRGRSALPRDDLVDFSTGTPALTQGNNGCGYSVAVTTQLQGNVSALFLWDTGASTGGACLWWASTFHGVLPNGSATAFTLGTVRAAPTVDGACNILIAGTEAGTGAAFLAVVDRHGALVSALPVADVPSGPPPTRPVLLSESLALVGVGSGPVLLSPGTACPTSDLAEECSGHGACACATGRCACASGWEGDACDAAASASPSPSASPSTTVSASSSASASAPPSRSASPLPPPAGNSAVAGAAGLTSAAASAVGVAAAAAVVAALAATWRLRSRLGAGLLARERTPLVARPTLAASPSSAAAAAARVAALGELRAAAAPVRT